MTGVCKHRCGGGGVLWCDAVGGGGGRRHPARASSCRQFALNCLPCACLRGARHAAARACLPACRTCGGGRRAACRWDKTASSQDSSSFPPMPLCARRCGAARTLLSIAVAAHAGACTHAHACMQGACPHDAQSSIACRAIDTAVPSPAPSPEAQPCSAPTRARRALQPYIYVLTCARGHSAAAWHA